jgi:hypothetical protein
MAGELGDNENSVYGENADVIFGGDEINGDSNAIVNARQFLISRWKEPRDIQSPFQSRGRANR